MAEPENNLTWIAAYYRTSNNSCQFRFDVLDYSIIEGSNFALQISSSNSGEMDYWVGATSHSNPQILYLPENKHISGGVQVFRNPALDAVLIQINNSSICSATNQQFKISTISEEGELIQSSPVISMDASPPQPAQLMFTFWDSLPASTPLQLIRRWDGAHSGPFGQRHGLKILLSAAEKYDIPVFLLDLKKPESLAGLDFIGEMDWISELQKKGVVILPDTTWGSALVNQLTLDFTREIAQNYGLKASEMVYSPFGMPNASFPIIFQFQENPSPIKKSALSLIIPLPYDPETSQPDWLLQSATPEGLSEETLRILLGIAGMNSEKLIVLGGSLPQSPLADITIAEPVMQYISSHPWIVPVNQYDLQTFQNERFTIFQYSSAQTFSTEEKDISVSLKNLPSNSFSFSALEFFSTLTSFSVSQPIYPLAQMYLGQVQNLIYASKWAASPTQLSTCNLDLDHDLTPECVLSNKDYLLIADPLGGRIELAAACNQNGHCFQFIGTTAQFSIGLSDPASWDFSHSYNPDPDVIPGALSDSGNPSETYRASTTPNSIELTSSSGITKSIQMENDKLSISVSSPTSSPYLIPLLIDPAARYAPGWDQNQIIFSSDPDNVEWNNQAGTHLLIRISGSEFNVSSYHQSLESFQASENPDLSITDYSLHPFPLVLLTIQPAHNWQLEFSAW